ncbi:MAG: endopeptidase La [Lentisphaerae bacterium]|nr:endopeptidase La [Lentisphaerota bacterium]
MNKSNNITVRTNMNTLDKNNGAMVLTLRNALLFPYILTPFFVDDPDDIRRVRKAYEGNRLIALFPEITEDAGEFFRRHPERRLTTVKWNEKEISQGGCKARIVKMLTLPDGSLRVLLRGLSRCLFQRPLDMDEPSYFPLLEDRISNNEQVEGMVIEAVKQFHNLAAFLRSFPEEIQQGIAGMTSPGRMIDLMTDSLSLLPCEKIWILQAVNLEDRALFLLELLNRELEVMQLGSKIQAEVNQNLSQNQREYFLREQLRVIKEELNEDSRNPDIISINERLQQLELPEVVAKTVEKELSRLELIPTMSPEYHVAYNYIDWLLSVPWNAYSADNLDLLKAQSVLEADHYGLEDVKKRILEFLAVMALNPDRKSPILCLVGPPGVGKTSLGESIARATNRKFLRIALGGVRDEAEIRGHRRTYIGAMPGRIVQSLKRAGTCNPVFMLDEIDKLAADHRGDPSSALLEVLDPAQNKTFNDHYLELDLDLSKVFFIATANVMEAIPAPLLDRMEVITLPGYTSFEKREIAKRYLVPRQLKENGLKATRFHITMNAVDEIIDYYTREAGVRKLEQHIAALCRKLARQQVEGLLEDRKRISVSAAMVRELLGPRRYLIDEAAGTPVVGSATGMAWTSVGGAILTVESLKLPGKGELKLTGQLGSVMKESAEAAFSLLKSRAEKYGIEPENFEKYNFHIHVPDGATPKDGPSAGITITSALYSLLKDQSHQPALAMTGEVNLRGQVTAIGGLKEKVIAALRSGVKTVVIPKENVKDLEDIPENVRNLLTFKPVDNIDDALKVIFDHKQRTLR